MATNANTAARVDLFGSFNYQRSSVSSFAPSAPGGITPGVKNFAVTGSGAGVGSKGFAISSSIAVGGQYSIDLSSFSDQFGDTATWSDIKAAILFHDSTSLALVGTIEVTGLAAQAIPGLRSSGLLKGQYSMMFYDPTGAGLSFVSPNSKVVIRNNDGANAATAVLFLLGE